MRASLNVSRLIRSAFGMTAALTLMAAVPAFAQPVGTSLTLKDASKAPEKTIIDDASWRCSGGVCMASGGASQPALRACKRVVAQLGAVTVFTWKGETLAADKLSTCNSAAKA
jgi:hypothetical protein